MSTRRQWRWLGAVVAAGMLVRVAYVALQPGFDPNFARPILDGAYYLEWARGLLTGSGSPDGAYYLAPGYPFFLACWLRLLGERFALLYLAQHALVGMTSISLGEYVRRHHGTLPGLACASLVLAFHPTLFFASVPVGESLAIALSAVALWIVSRPGRARGVWAGVAIGLACLVRPALLPVPFCWAGRRGRHGIWLVLAAIAILIPVTVRNAIVSGHPVPVSANMGITLYHGNGPGAEGIFTPALGLSGAIDRQRAEATAEASRRAGSVLDDVQADRWWGREAVRVRLADPAGTLGLLVRRATLIAASSEIGLDYAPRIDANPIRFMAPVPFALLLGLAVAAVLGRGWSGTGGFDVVCLIVVGFATPFVFYVSSRYRLPMAVFLCVPAGIGVGVVVDAVRTRSGRAVLAALACIVTMAASWIMPDSGLARSTEAGALANRALGWNRIGRLDRALVDIRRSLALVPDAPHALFLAGDVYSKAGRPKDAEAAYRLVLAADPGNVEAAGNLAALWIPAGRAREAIPVLERALARRPDHRVCWTNLVVAHLAVGDRTAALEVARRAERAGVSLEPALLRELHAGSEEYGW